MQSNSLQRADFAEQNLRRKWICEQEEFGTNSSQRTDFLKKSVEQMINERRIEIGNSSKDRYILSFMIILNILKIHASAMRIKDILSNVFKAHGFAVSGERLLIAVKNGTKIIIGCKDGDIAKEEIAELLTGEADKRIFASTQFFDEEMQSFAKASNIILWDRDQLEREVGKAVLLAGRDIFFEKKERKEFVVKPKIGISGAKAIGKKLGEPSVALELIPYYVYNYSCEVLVEGSLDTKMNKGIIAVNGITKEAEEWSMDIETGTPDSGYAKLPVRINEKKSWEIAYQRIIELNTKVVEVMDERDVAVVFEKRKIKPKEDAVTIDLSGLYYFPVWNIKGKTGIMIINAVTSEVIKEEIYKNPVLVDEKIDVI